MRRAARTDAPHADIRDTLRQLGLYVIDLAAGDGEGRPDLLVYHPGRDEWTPIEVKSERGRLTDGQAARAKRGIYVPLAHSLTEALEAVGLPAKIATGKPK